jgi:hypothetical protein
MATQYPLLILGAVVLPVALSCSTEGEAVATWHGSMDTLPSGQVVVYNTDEPLWRDGSGWRVVEDLRIGTVEGNGPDLFGNIGSLEVDAAGRIYVLETQANEIRVFDAEGGHVRTIGREGGGPGEFNRPVLIQFGPDGNLWVVDPQNNRLSVFDTAGTYLEGKYALGGFIMIPWPGGFDEHSHYYTPVPQQRGDDFGIALARFDSDLEIIDTIAIPEDPEERDGFELHTGDSHLMASIPFAPGFRWRLAPNGTLWAMLEEHYRFIQLTLSGDTVRSFTREFDPLPVTEADMEEAREELEWFINYGGKVDWSKIPDHKPATEDFFFDDEGNVWVVPVTTAERSWQVVEVFDPDGRFLGRIDLPFRLTRPYPIIRAHVMHAVVQDAMGVPYVVRAWIEKQAED